MENTIHSFDLKALKEANTAIKQGKNGNTIHSFNLNTFPAIKSKGISKEMPKKPKKKALKKSKKGKNKAIKK